MVPNYPTGGSPTGVGQTGIGSLGGAGSGSGFSSPSAGSLSYNYNYYNDYDQYTNPQIPSRTNNQNANTWASWFGQGGNNNYFRRQGVARNGARRTSRNRLNRNNINRRRIVSGNNRNINTGNGFNSWFLNTIIPGLNGNQNVNSNFNQNFNQNQLVRLNRNQIRRRPTNSRQNIYFGNQGSQPYYSSWFG